MGLRNILLKDYREEVISKAIFEEIQKLENIKKKKLIRIIDYGSGFNPVVIKKLIKKLSTKYKNVNFQANCYDYYNRSQINLMNKQKNIKFFHVDSLKNKNLGKYHFCLIIDVLHHIGLKDKDKIFKIFRKLKNISKFIFIKDHFQYGFFSNFILILMDIFGNYKDGVKIPSIYFTKETYNSLIKKINLLEIKRLNNLSYYKWYWFYLNSKKLQFISILKKK
tara:strand:- start:1165 stop:1830 length:666 start_codon:yes stop_codon:yes gene_type:complete